MSFLDLCGEDFRLRPHEVLGPLREQNWYAECPVGPAVLRYEPVQTLLSMRQLRTPSADLITLQGITEGPLVATMGDTFDISRERAVQLTFGAGMHYCLGAALARVELQVRCRGWRRG